jgi:hypothetical protein
MLSSKSGWTERFQIVCALIKRYIAAGDNGQQELSVQHDLMTVVWAQINMTCRWHAVTAVVDHNKLLNRLESTPPGGDFIWLACSSWLIKGSSYKRGDRWWLFAVLRLMLNTTSRVYFIGELTKSTLRYRAAGGGRRNWRVASEDPQLGRRISGGWSGGILLTSL